jgi:subtilase family serine protease
VIPSLRAERMLLVLRRSAEQESALQSYLREVQDPASSEYHHFLTPELFATRFGVADSDLSTLQSWLASHGLTVDRVSKGRTTLEFSGSASSVEEAFHTLIHQYQVDGEIHLANATDPQIPTALAPVVAGVASLHDFRPRPLAVRGPKVSLAGDRQVRPDLTIPISGKSYLFLSPGDAATIYDAPTSLNAHLAPGQAAFDGTGVTIGVVEDVEPDLSPLGYYQTAFGLPRTTYGVNVVLDGAFGNLDPNADPTEVLLDLEIAQALAPGAKLAMYVAGDTAFEPGIVLAAMRAVDDNAVDILSVSYGACETDLGAAGNLQILNTWEQAAAQGITVVVSSGDSGSAGCNNPNTDQAATKGFAVNGLASTPYNVAVGGTDFSTLPSKFSTFVSTTNGTYGTSAVGYIPEFVWNDAASNTGLLASNRPATNSSGQTNIWAGGGGASSAGDASGAGYAKPAWQQSFPPSNSDTVRDLPDVSFFAGAGSHQALWAVCLEADCQGTNPTISGVGGTSASAPAFAGILALVKQKLGSRNRLGMVNWTLYDLAQSQPAIFHNIGASNNAVVCVAGSPNCGSNGFLTGYNTATGYNLATGLGSVDATKLVNGWSSVGLTSTATTLSLDKTSFVHGTPVNLAVGVTPTTAGGNVSIVNSASSQQLATGSGHNSLFLPLNAGAATAAFSQLPGGTYSVYATYGGDGSHSGSTSQGVAVNVTPENSTLQLTASSLDANQNLVSLDGVTVPLGTFTILRGVPLGQSQAGSANPVANATGTVSFGDATSNTPICQDSVPLDSIGAAELHRGSCAAGQHTITATYYGDLSYKQSTSAPISFTVLKGSTALSLSSSASSVTYDTVTVTANITFSSPLSLFYHNSVVFTNTTNNTALGSVPVVGRTCGNLVCYTSSLDLRLTQLLNGTNTIAATYPGDDNFDASNDSAVTINCIANCSNGAGQSLWLDTYRTSNQSFVRGGQLTTSLQLFPSPGFTGPVNFTCAVTGQLSTDVNLPICTLNPAVITVSDIGSSTTSATITTAPATSAALTHTSPIGRYGSAVGGTFAIGFLLWLPARRRALLQAFRAATCLAVIFGLAGCGGGGTQSSSTNGTGGGLSGGTSADTYTVTFRAVDAATGTLTAQTFLTFKVL